MEPTGQDAVEFWNFAATKGLMNKETAGAWRVACKTVLSTVEPDTWEKVDLLELDVDAFLQRFERLRTGDLKPDSLRVYQSRFRSAVTSYLDYLRNPSTWQYRSAKPGPRADGESGARRSGRQAAKKTKSVDQTAASVESDPLPGQTSVPPGVKMLTHNVPLRPDLIIPITLPVNLTKPEVTRLTRFLEAVAFEVQLALPPGLPDHAGSEQ